MEKGVSVENGRFKQSECNQESVELGRHRRPGRTGSDVTTKLNIPWSNGRSETGKTDEE